MVRVEVKDFQSIVHEVIEINGFSALVGRSNIGKSAVVRAIKAALTGAPVESLVRHSVDCPRVVKGSKSCRCFCSVRIVAEGLDLLWEKGDDINQYLYNGTKYTAVSRGTPDFLLDSFGPAKVGDEKEMLQISDQFRPIFLLDKSGTTVADVLSDVVRLDQINTAIRLSEKDRKEASATRKVREKDIVELRTSLARYDGLDDSLLRVSNVEAMNQKAQELTSEWERLDKFVEEAYSLAREIKTLGGVKALEIPECTTAEANYQVLVRLLTMDADHLGRSAEVTRLAGVDEVSVPSVSEATTAKDQLLRLVEWSGRLDAIRTFYERSKELSTLTVPATEAALTSKSTLVRISEWVTRLDNLSRTVIELEAAGDTAKREEEAALAALSALGICPTCRREFSTNHVHAVSA